MTCKFCFSSWTILKQTWSSKTPTTFWTKSFSRTISTIVCLERVKWKWSARVHPAKDFLEWTRLRTANVLNSTTRWLLFVSVTWISTGEFLSGGVKLFDKRLFQSNCSTFFGKIASVFEIGKKRFRTLAPLISNSFIGSFSFNY